MPRSKSVQTSNSRSENPPIRTNTASRTQTRNSSEKASKPISTASKTQTRESSKKPQAESTAKSGHRIHLPHIPHPHLHRHDEESTPTTTTKSNPAKPPSAHTNFLPNPANPRTSSSTASTSKNRPAPPLRRQTSIKTRYMTMLLDLDTIPRLHNILASFFTWILLAGYLVFPGTFTSLQDETTTIPVIGNSTTTETAEKVFLKHVKNAPLLWIAGFCCGIGVVGMGWLWWRWRENFVWLINRIFLYVIFVFYHSPLLFIPRPQRG